MKYLFIAVFSLVCTHIYVFGQAKVSVTANPQKIFIERGEYKKYINFDFLVENNSSDTLTLTKILMTVFDKNNYKTHQRFIDNNGTASSIQMMPNRLFSAHEKKLVFNPFSEFDSSLLLNKIEFQFTFTSNQDNESLVSTVVYPLVYVQEERYSFPLKGKVLVYDAHDYYSHHRRFDYEFLPIKQLGISSNFMRYAYDFVMLDSENNQFVGNEDISDNYFGYGRDVYAVADGTVVYVSNTHRDDGKFNIPEIANNPLELYGNCIAIQHKDNNISIYGHLKQNSLKVKVGDVVKAKQNISSVGRSGSSFFPHLHFEIRNSIENSAEGVPAYFSNIFQLGSGKYLKLKSGLPTTGRIITTK